MSVATSRPEPAPAAPTVTLRWRAAHVYQCGVQTYRVTLTYMARVWTPPAILDGVESANFIFFLSTALVVMEGYHAVRYVLRELHRFKTESARGRSSLLGRALSLIPLGNGEEERGEPGAADAKAPKKLDALLVSEDADACRAGLDGVPGDEDDDGDDAALHAQTAPTSFCHRVVSKTFSFFARRPPPATAATTLSGDALHDDDDEDDVTMNRPLRYGARGESEFDLMSRDVSVPFDLSTMPTQRGLGSTAYAVGERGHSVGLHELGDEDEGNEEEEQTWEATPEMLMHYWKQLERTILTAPRRNPKRFFRSLPESMTTYEPDAHAVHAWFDSITRHLKGGASPWAAVTAWTAGVGAAADAHSGPAASSAGAAPALRGPCAGSMVFRVPPQGCFAYHTRVSLDDFYPDTEDETEEDSEEQSAAGEEEKERAGQLPGATVFEGEEPPTEAESSETPASAAAATVVFAAPENQAEEEGVEAAAETHRRRTHTLHWEALFLIWFNVTEVPVSSREIRALLLKASPPPFMSPAVVRDDGPTTFDLASANLSLLWFWSTLQRVFETLVVNEDVEKCESDIEELQTYVAPLFMKCIARWPPPPEMEATSIVAFDRGLVGFICVVQTAWATLTMVLHRLLAVRRRLYYRNTWSLLRYMYSSSKAKLMSAALITVMMTISSRVSGAGRVVRERIANYVENGGEESVGGGEGQGRGSRLSLRLVLGLCGFELTRMAVQYVITNTTSEFIVLTASQRREVVKMQLYEALSHTQLTFYEQHTYEEVEEIIYYVNDMEGIDVQLHQYLFNAINVLMELREALRPFTYRSMAVAAGVAMAPYALRSIASMVEQRYLLAQREGYLPSGAYAVEDDYQGDDDDANVLREGAMLRGDEIIAAIPQLRPYGADVRLVRWWNRHQQRRQHIDMSHGERASTQAAARRGGGGGGRDTAPTSPLGPARGPLSPTRRNLAAAAGGGGGGGSAAARAKSFSPQPVPLSQRLREFVRTWITDEDVGLVRSAILALAQLPHGKLLPGAGKAVLDLSEWLLPMAASAYGVAWCGQTNLDPFQLVQGMQAIEAAVDSLGEARDTAEMVGYNAYKASMLERLLQPTQWEVLSREEEPHMANFTITARSVGEANDGRQRSLVEAQQRLAKARDARPLAGPLLDSAVARAGSFYRRHVLRHIEIHGIRLRHAPMAQLPRRRGRRAARKAIGTGASSSTSTTPHSAALKSGGGDGGSSSGRGERGGGGPLDSSFEGAEPTPTEDEEEDDEEEDDDDILSDGAPLFSGDIVLWSPAQHRGRFVCITAPNGGGKTALINLLLALYVNCGAPLSASSTAASPHAGLLDTGSVTFCFASRTRNRRQRRGGLNARGGNASSPNLAKVARLNREASSYTISPSSTGRSLPPFASRSNAAITTDRPSSGTIDTQGESRVDLRVIPADVLRRQIFSYVPEMPTIFSGATVAQNISLAGYVSVAADALMRRVSQCAELAQCDFIQRLPLGMLTRISDNSGSSWNAAGQYRSGTGNTSVVRLSADQAKRLMLARAYYHGGEVLLLDEPTKEIEDTSTAQKMCDGWRRLLERGYCTGVICMTMDETLLSMADEVIVLP